MATSTSNDECDRHMEDINDLMNKKTVQDCPLCQIQEIPVFKLIDVHYARMIKILQDDDIPIISDDELQNAFEITILKPLRSLCSITGLLSKYTIPKTLASSIRNHIKDHKLYAVMDEKYKLKDVDNWIIKRADPDCSVCVTITNGCKCINSTRSPWSVVQEGEAFLFEDEHKRSRIREDIKSMYLYERIIRRPTLYINRSAIWCTCGWKDGFSKCSDKNLKLAKNMNITENDLAHHIEKCMCLKTDEKEEEGKNEDDSMWKNAKTYYTFTGIQENKSSATLDKFESACVFCRLERPLLKYAFMRKYITEAYTRYGNMLPTFHKDLNFIRNIYHKMVYWPARAFHDSKIITNTCIDVDLVEHADDIFEHFNSHGKAYLVEESITSENKSVVHEMSITKSDECVLCQNHDPVCECLDFKCQWAIIKKFIDTNLSSKDITFILFAFDPCVRKLYDSLIHIPYVFLYGTSLECDCRKPIKDVLYPSMKTLKTHVKTHLISDAITMKTDQEQPKQ